LSRKIVAYTDGGSRGNPGPAAAGIVLTDTRGRVLLSQGLFLGKHTNNFAEYTGAVKALAAALRLGAERVELFADSELLVRQLNGQYRVRSANILPLYEQAMTLLGKFKSWTVTHVLRARNQHADRMVNQALDAGRDVTEKAAAPPTEKCLRIGALISGGGRTILNLLDHIQQGNLPAEIRAVISSRSAVSGVDRMKEAGLPVTVIRKKDYDNLEAFSEALEKQLSQADVDLVVQGGWLCLWKIPERFHHRVMNIHPALLPSFGGQGMWGHHVHEAVLEAGCKVSGCTVHFCTDEYDSGPIIVQRTCPVREDDTPETLAARVFEQECLAYPEAIRLFAEGRLTVEDHRVRIRS